MSKSQDVNVSKALSWLLRHGAPKENVIISDEGFVSIRSILNHKSFRQYRLSDIQRVVERQEKQRFTIRQNPSSNELEIKANHGHSFNVQNLQLTPLEGTESTVVVHGTYLKNWDIIKHEGLSRMKRTHIHFASGVPGDSGVISGIRNDCNVLIFMNVQKLLEDKIPLLVSPSGVILSPGNHLGIIPPTYFKEVKFVRCATVNKPKGNHNLSTMSGKGIFVRGFPQTLAEHELKEFFKKFGNIEEIIFNQRKMFAIIEFQKRASADLVLSREMFLKGKKLKVARRKPRVSHSNERQAGPNHANGNATNVADKEGETESLSETLSATNFDSNIMRFTKEMEAIGLKQKVDIICESLLRSMGPCFRGCKILPFGSSVTGLASKESDVDIYVDIGHWKSDENEYSPSNLVMLTKRILSKNYEFMKCIPIPRARVPILKCFHKYTQLNCDINFQNALGVFNSQLIQFYTSLDPILRELIMFIKYWAKTNHICGPGSFTSYAVVMLFLFYIQQMPNSTIPTVEVLQKNCKSHNVVQGWDCRFDDDPRKYPRSGSKKPLVTLLSDFFQFYANFEFEKNVVIMNYGVSVPRDSFKSATENPMCHRYMLALQQQNADPIELDRVVCVLDPFVLNHNITAGIGLPVLNRFQIRCFKSAEVCQKIENGVSGLTLSAIVGSIPQQKKTKFPYLELWKDNCVKLTIPLKGFNPRNIFDNGEFEINDSSRVSLMEVLICQLKKMFDKILRLSVVREEVELVAVNSDKKQIAKMEGMDDVHGRNEMKILSEMKLHLSGCFHVWNGRGPAYKEFSFPNEMNHIEREMHITNYIVDTFYKGSDHEPHRTDVKCIFVPIMNFRCLEVDITPCNQYETFKPMIGFLLNMLHKWLKE